MTVVVVDASLVVSALLDDGDEGAWAEQLLQTRTRVAPALMPVEVANILRRANLCGDITAECAAQAHNDLLDLSVELFPYEPFGPRVWELRASVTPYDAWYVAIAEQFALPLATLDVRLTRATGPRCRFETPGL